MRGKVVIIALLLVVVYTFLVAVFFFAAPFMVSWGSPIPWYLRVINFFQETPFSLMQKDGKVNLYLIFANSLFWTICVGVFLFLILHKKRKKATQ